MTLACISTEDYTVQIIILSGGVAVHFYVTFCFLTTLTIEWLGIRCCFLRLLRLRLTWEPTLIAWEMLEDLRTGYVDHLPNFSFQPTSNLIPFCFTSYRQRQRDEQEGQSMSSFIYLSSIEDNLTFIISLLKPHWVIFNDKLKDTNSWSKCKTSVYS